MYKPPRDTIDALNEQVRASNLPPTVKVLVVFGYPRSDIGKGTLVSHLLPLLNDANVIKFDGLLNTNVDGRFTTNGHDDFGLYETQNPGMQISKQNHLLGGNLLYDFISKYGETNERLTLVPHLERFFRLQLQQRWKTLGEPQHLIIEMGGTPDDTEVGYALAAIRELKVQLGTQCKVLLLTELGHNNLFAKSKVAQRGVSELVARGIVPDIIVTREPHLEHAVSVSERLDFEIQMQERIAERSGMTFNNIISMPYFADLQDTSYKDFVEKNLSPLIQEPKKYANVLLGTNDLPEIEEWKMLLGDRFNLTDPQELGMDIEIERDDASIQRSSHARARSFSRASGLPTITGEAGFYINALGGKPGAGVRTWGGELPVKMNNEEIFNYLRAQVEPLEDTSAYIEGSVTIALPSGEEYHLKYRDYGTIDKDCLAQGYKPDEYPIGQVFKHTDYNATWVAMTTKQKRQERKEIINAIIGLLNDSVTKSKDKKLK